LHWVGFAPSMDFTLKTGTISTPNGTHRTAKSLNGTSMRGKSFQTWKKIWNQFNSMWRNCFEYVFHFWFCFLSSFHSISWISVCIPSTLYLLKLTFLPLSFKYILMFRGRTLASSKSLSLSRLPHARRHHKLYIHVLLTKIHGQKNKRKVCLYVSTFSSPFSCAHRFICIITLTAASSRCFSCFLLSTRLSKPFLSPRPSTPRIGNETP